MGVKLRIKYLYLSCTYTSILCYRGLVLDTLDHLVVESLSIYLHHEMRDSSINLNKSVTTYGHGVIYLVVNLPSLFYLTDFRGKQVYINQIKKVNWRTESAIGASSKSNHLKSNVFIFIFYI